MSTRPLLTLGLTALLAGLAACGPRPAAEPAVPAVYVTTARAVPDDDRRQLSGVLRPRLESELGFRVGGLLTHRAVDVGMPVRQGEVLARLDASDHALALAAAQQQLQAAEVDAAQAVSDAARFERLAADGSVGSADAERQRARADAATARRVQAARQVDVAANRVGYATLRAPFDGIVTAVRAEPGQVVGEGQPVIALARRGELEAVVDLPEQLVASVRERRATVRLTDGPDGSARPASLRELASSAHPVTRTYRARYAVAGTATDWTLGRSVVVSLDAAAAPGAAPRRTLVELPVGALVRDAQGTAVWLTDAAQGSLRRQAVQIAQQSQTHVRVSGVPEGAQVVSVGAQKLDAGMRVRPLARPLAAPAPGAAS